MIKLKSSMIPSQTILFTRQLHEADRAGRHYDIRLVAGDKAYSWATKKDIPPPGQSIILYEQPVHTREYALTKRLVIPPGNYGSGTTTLDFVRKAKIENKGDHMILTSSDGSEKYLLKHVGKYDKTAWLFKNLTGVEKRASLSLAAGLHFVQNGIADYYIRSGKLGKVIGGQLAKGYAGVKDSAIDKVNTSFMSVASPELARIKLHSRQLGQYVRDRVDNIPISKRESAVARLVSRGEFGRASKHIDKVPRVKELLEAGKARLGISNLPTNRDLPEVVKQFRSKENPILSKVLRNVVDHANHTIIPKRSIPDKIDSKYLLPHMTGANIAASVVDPATGALNVAKVGLMSDAGKGNKYIDWARNKFNRVVVTDPIKHNLKLGLSGQERSQTISDKLQQFIHRFGINATADHLANSSRSIGLALKKDLKIAG